MSCSNFVMHLLHLEIERTLHTARPLSCIVLDIDHFKLINDRYGHDAGDVALQRVCQVLTQDLRINDTLGRPHHRPKFGPRNHKSKYEEIVRIHSYFHHIVFSQFIHGNASAC